MPDLKPVFKIGENDYSRWLADDGLKPSRNDSDADGSGRNILTGLMYRKKIVEKRKWTVSFISLSPSVMAQLEKDTSPEFIHITTLDPKQNRYVTREYYCSTINEGIQRYLNGSTKYDGVTFNVIER